MKINKPKVKEKSKQIPLPKERLMQKEDAYGFLFFILFFGLILAIIIGLNQM